MSNPIITIQNVTVSFRQSVAVDNISLEINKRELVGIIGPNGAGKTTLLKVINGLTNIAGGEVRIFGKRLSGNSNNLRKRIGYVAQQQHVDPRLPINVHDAVLMGRYGRIGLLRRPGGQDHKTADRAIEMVGITHLSKRPIGHLSGGELQRLAIARALAQQPEILLLDEPSASLDWSAQRGLLRLVKQIHEAQGLTTVIVTHDLNLVSNTCDRVVFMKAGNIIAEGNADIAADPDTISLLYDSDLNARRQETKSHIIT